MVKKVEILSAWTGWIPLCVPVYHIPGIIFFSSLFPLVFGKKETFFIREIRISGNREKLFLFFSSYLYISHNIPQRIIMQITVLVDFFLNYLYSIKYMKKILLSVKTS